MPVLYLDLMPFQKEFVTAEERFLALMAGRRAGKTDAIKGRIKYRTQRPGFSYTYITPLYSQALEVYRELTGDMAYRHRIRRVSERPYPQYWLHNGSRVKFKSFQRPEGLRSTGEDEICIDESQDPSVHEYDVKTIILPMLGDRRGSLVFAGQFRGHDWRYSQFWVYGQPESKRPQYRSWAIHSREGYVFQGPEGEAELALQRSITPPAVWDQEWACIPSANANSVFPIRQIEAITGGEVCDRPRGGRRYVIGLDLGRVVDQSAVVVLEVESGCVVWAEKLPQRQEHALQAKRVGQIASQYGNACVVMDCTGGATGGQAPSDSYVQFYRQTVKDLRPFTWSRDNKQNVINELALQIEQRRIQIPVVHSELFKELRQYEYKYKRGRYEYNAPTGQHDDYVAALAQAVWGRARGWAGNSHGMHAGYATV